MTPELKLYFFGPIRVERAGETVDISLSKAKSLLVYLILTGTVHSRDALAALFWPESDQSSARGSLRRTLYRLNKEVGEELLLATTDTIAPNPAANVWVDVALFRECAASGLADDHSAPSPADGRVAALEQAATLYHDDFLAGFTLPDCPDFDEWQFFQRESLRRSLAEVLIALITVYQQEGEWERAIAVSRRWLSLDPLHEPAHRHLMQLYARAGQQAAALRQYEECVRLLDEELGVKPEEETHALYEAIRTRQLLPARTVAPSSPPGQEANTTRPARLPHNLPVTATPFVGRERELAVLDDYLTHPNARLITIAGPGGMGKTRLALATASRYLAFAAKQSAAPVSGVYFVSLAPLAAASQLVPAIAEAANFSLESGGTENRPAREQLLDYLREKQMLLILDNFEHLLDAVDLVEAIIQAAPDVTLVVTSRQRLALQEEYLLVIPGLDYPQMASELEGNADSLARFAAVQLFVEAAQRRQHDFELTAANAREISAICRLVEGMPLALELAAAWIDILPLPDIVSEIRQSIDFLESDLRNLPRRQQSMRAVFDSTWQLLAPAEQEAFARLSVFRGGFTREAVQAVTGASLRRLTRLSVKALLHFDRSQNRYHIHELLRQYAVEKLVQDPATEAEVRSRHSDYYCRRLRAKAPLLQGAQQEIALAALEAGADNIQQAWRWAAQQGRYDLLYQALDPLGYLHEWLGRIESGQRAFHYAAEQLQTGAAAQTAGGVSRLLARLLGWEATFTYLSGDVARAEQLLQQAAALLGSGDPAGQDNRADRAFLYLQRGIVAAVMGKTEAYSLYERSLALFRALKYRWECADVLARMGRWTHVLADFQEAERRLRESLAIRRELGDRRGIAEALGSLSQTAVEQGRFAQAEQLARESNGIYEELGNRYGMASGLRQLGIILMWLGKNEEAHDCLAQSLVYSRELGSRPLIAHVHSLYGLVLSLLGRFPEAEEQGRAGLALIREIGDANQLGWSLWTLGWILASSERYAEAEAVLRESVAVYHQFVTEATVPRQLGWSLSLLAYVLWEQGYRVEAQQRILEVLPLSIRLQDVLPLLTALPAVALMLAEQGEKEWAAALHALTWRYSLPANDHGWLQRAGAALAATAARLPAETLHAARERAQTLDLQQAATILLDELPALGWAT